MTAKKRTADVALEIVQSIRDDEIKGRKDIVASLLTEELLNDVFDEAWRQQFNDDRRDNRRGIRELINEVIEEKITEDEQ